MDYPDGINALAPVRIGRALAVFRLPLAH
jgi:hypothetical protein